jgi:hypothetical protein
MNRLVGAIVAGVGVLVAALGMIPSHIWRLSGLGGAGHRTADAVLALGIVLVIVGVLWSVAGGRVTLPWARWRLPHVWRVPALLALLVAALLAGAGAAYLAASAGTLHCSPASSLPAGGPPFVQPTLPGQCPAYTIADVRAAILKTCPTSHCFGEVTVTGKPPTIRRIAFISPHGVLECHVELVGPFWNYTVEAPPGPLSTPAAKRVPIRTIDFDLDPRTGSMFQWGLSPV